MMMRLSAMFDRCVIHVCRLESNLHHEVHVEQIATADVSTFFAILSFKMIGGFQKDFLTSQIK
jgi:hypothetical protein